MKKGLLFFILFLSCIDLFAQNISSENITYNSASINFENTASQSLKIHVFTKYAEDTICFYEDFSLLPRANIGNNISTTGIPVNIPLTYTLFPNCKANNIFNTNGDSCYFNTNGTFITPFLDLSRSNGNYRVKFKIKNYDNSKKTIYISASDALENYPNSASITLAKNEFREYDTIFSNGSSKSRIKFYSPATKVAIDDISISYTSIQRTPILSSPFQTTNSSILLQNLNPNTTYHCFVEGRADTISFKTLKTAILKEIKNINPSSAKINFKVNDISSNRKIILKQKSNYQTILADDLFLSEYTCADGANKAIELYNGTGEDISLKDYKIRYFIATNNLDTTYSFSQYDTIKANSCIVLMTFLQNLNDFNEGIFYTNHKSVNFTIKGNDAIALMKDTNFVDIFGCIGHNPGINGWTATGISTAKTTLRRKASVNKGIKINPNNSFPTLSSEWTQIGAVGNYNSINFADFGKHTMDNAFGGFDSLVYSIPLGLNDTNYIFNNLKENTIYEAYIVVGTGEDSVVSNHISFKTGRNTQIIANGNWNNVAIWSKGMPTNKDNAIIPCGQKLVIPNGFSAKCNNLIIKDTINETKASLINNGSLDIENKVLVEAYFTAYTSDLNGWNLHGLPISIDTNSQNTIGNFYSIGTNDDLYYWQEDYTDSENNGRWINWKDIPQNTGNFFKDTRGYLISYNQNRKLSFSGHLKNNPNYTLLNNVTLSSPNDERGWHLCSNPYPFYVKINQLQRTNVSLPSLLNPSTSNYTALTLNDSIPPFAGFMVQVSNNTNSLIINKAPSEAKSILDRNILSLKVSSSSGGDMTRLILMDSASTFGYDIRFDNRKLSGLGKSPEIYSKVGNNRFSLNAIPNIVDSIIMDINFLAKKEDNYTISLDMDNMQEFFKIGLYDKATGAELIDFKTDTAYSFHSPANNDIDKFQLKIFKTNSSLNNVNSIGKQIRIKQIKDEVYIFSNQKVEFLSLTNIKGQEIIKTHSSNMITIPHRGVFVLTITTKGNKYQQKIINL